MTEETTIWQDLRACKKEKFDADRARFLADAQAADDGGWTKHTQWHWSRMVNGERLDYWPSRKKYQYRGKVKRGDVMKIVKQAATRCKHCHTPMQPASPSSKPTPARRISRAARLSPCPPPPPGQAD